ncbi:MAG TPA: DUF6036 family nucleotidyltransferase [Myxococcota bacterium]|nr:DUF6036 family nucleotidyltransferase [Myxococcota bacterium]
MLGGFDRFTRALTLLNGRLVLLGSPRFNLVVCGGSALVAAGYLDRATKDIDVVALADDAGVLIDPEPFPSMLVQAVGEVAVDLGLPKDWLNNGPSSGDGGIFRLGLPAGFAGRVTWQKIGDRLWVGLVSRYDQIHFKLYAGVDRSGGYHADDLRALAPNDDEMVAAAAWALSHDPSEGFLQALVWFLTEFGYGHIVERIQGHGSGSPA